MNFPNPTNNNEMCNFDMSWLTNQQQQQQQQQQLPPAIDMDDSARTRIDDLINIIKSVGKGIESGAVNRNEGLHLMRNLELRYGNGIAWNGSRGVTVSSLASATSSTTASAMTSTQTLPHNHDAELRLDPLELAAAPAPPLHDWQFERLVAMLSKPDEVNNPPQKTVKPDALLDLSTLFQIIGKGIDSGAPKYCSYEQAVQLLKRLQLYDLVLNGIIRVPGFSREEGSRVSSGRLVSAPSSVPASTAASATTSPLTLPRYDNDAELQQDLLMMGAASLLGSPMIQTPPTSPKFTATPAPLRNWQIETVNGMLSQPDEVNPQQQKKKVDAALLQQQPEVQKTTELTRQVTPDEKKKKTTSVVMHNSVSNVQQRQVAQQARAKLPLKKRPVYTAAAASSIQNSLRELDEQQKKEKRKKLFQQRVFSPAKMPPKKKASPKKKKTATLWARPDKVCRDESCSSLKQAGYDGYCIRHCKLFNNAKWAENKEKKAERKAERKAAAEKKLVV